MRLGWSIAINANTTQHERQMIYRINRKAGLSRRFERAQWRGAVVHIAALHAPYVFVVAANGELI
jgi:hypothetical protein